MSSTIPLPPREQLYNRFCSNRHTHTLLNLRLKIGRGRSSWPAGRPGFDARRLALRGPEPVTEKTLDTHSGLSLGQEEETGAEQEGRGSGYVYRKSVDEFLKIGPTKTRFCEIRTPSLSFLGRSFWQYR
jgi:hypothetical protein